MRINSITLINIGPYIGENEFDLSTTKSRNVVLIGGQNGAGKTTLLKAIKIGLFGCFAYGYKSENNSYFTEIKNLLNNQTDSQNFEIRIEFDIVENYIKNSYVMTRTWSFRFNAIDENYYIWENGEKLSAYQAMEFVNKLRSFTSPALINSFIYDGEKVGSIIEQNKLAPYIKEVFDSIFNINLLEQLEADLTSYLSKTNKSDSNPLQYEATQLISDIKLAKKEISVMESKILGLEDYINNIHLDIKSKRNEFLRLQGLSPEEIEKYKKNISVYERENDINNRILRGYYEEILPFALVEKDILSVIKQAKNEIPLRYASVLKEIEEYLHADLSEYIDKLSADQAQILFNLNATQIEKLEEFDKHIGAEQKRAQKIVKIKPKEYLLTNNMKQRVENSESVAKIAEITKQISEDKNLLIDKNDEKDKLVAQYEEKKLKLQNMITKYEQLNSSIRKDKLSDSSYVLGSLAYDICSQFRGKIVKEKLKNIAELACEIFNDTIRKKEYISQLTIDEEFILKAVDKYNNIIELNTFSAGEMQILVSSVIWAMFKLSGRRELFVFDTPLARLDTENRIQFINKIVKTISDQVVILSTDSEFTGANYEAVRDSVQRSYLLSYKDTTKSTEILNTYFVTEN